MLKPLVLLAVLAACVDSARAGLIIVETAREAVAMGSIEDVTGRPDVSAVDDGASEGKPGDGLFVVNERIDRDSPGTVTTGRISARANQRSNVRNRGISADLFAFASAEFSAKQENPIPTATAHAFSTLEVDFDITEAGTYEIDASLAFLATFAGATFDISVVLYRGQAVLLEINDITARDDWHQQLALAADSYSIVARAEAFAETHDEALAGATSDLSFRFGLAAIPEPASMHLMAIGSAALVIALRHPWRTRLRQ